MNIDLAPTLLDLAGVAVPEQVDGRSLVPLFTGKAAGWRRSFLAEYFIDPGQPRIPTWQAVRTARWKYIHYPDFREQDEFYDLRVDPYEMKNLVTQPSA